MQFSPLRRPIQIRTRTHRRHLRFVTFYKRKKNTHKMSTVSKRFAMCRIHARSHPIQCLHFVKSVFKAWHLWCESCVIAFVDWLRNQGESHFIVSATHEWMAKRWKSDGNEAHFHKYDVFFLLHLPKSKFEDCVWLTKGSHFCIAQNSCRLTCHLTKLSYELVAFEHGLEQSTALNFGYVRLLIQSRLY